MLVGSAAIGSAASAIDNVQTSGWNSLEGYTSGVKSVGKVVDAFGNIVNDVNGMTDSGSNNGFDNAFKLLDNSPVWYGIAQAAQTGATEVAAKQYMTAAYSEQNLHNYNAQVDYVNADLIERNAQLAIIQQKRADKVSSAAREVAVNASGFMTAGSPTQALLLHEDAVAEYSRALISYQAANQAIAKRQEGDLQRYQGNLAVYMGAQQADNTRKSAYYRALSSYAEINAQRSIRQAELSAYGQSKQPIDSQYDGSNLGNTKSQKAEDLSTPERDAKIKDYYDRQYQTGKYSWSQDTWDQVYETGIYAPK